MMLQAELEARNFAMVAHSGQVRNYTGEPYIYHPARMVERLRVYYGGDDSLHILQATWLHDTMEDCGITYEALAARFGDKVADMVKGLTANTKPGMSRTEKHEEAIRRLYHQHALVHTIKYVDMMDNVVSLIPHCTDLEYAKTFIDDRLNLLMYLNKGRRDLRNQAFSTLRNFRAMIGINHDAPFSRELHQGDSPAADDGRPSDRGEQPSA